MEKDLPLRGRSDCGDSWKLSSMSAQMTSSSASGHLDTEVTCPPLAVISTRVKSATTLEICSNFETATVKYTYDTSTLSQLLKSIGERLKGRQALSIALVVHGSPGCFKLCPQKVMWSRYIYVENVYMIWSLGHVESGLIRVCVYYLLHASVIRCGNP